MESVTDVLNWELVGGQLLVYRQNGHRGPNCTDAGKFSQKYPILYPILLFLYFAPYYKIFFTCFLKL